MRSSAVLYFTIIQVNKFILIYNLFIFTRSRYAVKVIFLELT